MLALQGDFEAHARVLRHLGANVREARTAEELSSAEAIVLPGGESTTMRKLMEGTGIEKALERAKCEGKPILATCAGAILLARTAQNPDGQGLGLLEMDVVRNAYGRQLDSTILPLQDVRHDLLGDGEMRAVFIRAPRFTHLGPDVEVLARRDSDPVLVRQGSILAASFHPELTEDGRVHLFFLEGNRMCAAARKNDEETKSR